MIAFASMLLAPAQMAGMKTPDKVDDAKIASIKDEYPHFFTFCCMQLGRRMPSPGCHWENARIVAGIPDTEIRTVNPSKLEKLGFV